MSAAEPSFEFSFTQEDFEKLRKLVTGEVGIMLPDNKKTLVYTRLVRRLRQLQLPDFTAYVALVEKELKIGKTDELNAIINAMTTNVTHFFRENHHFIDLTRRLEEWAKAGKRINIWSCASATGEEPWSIAMTVADVKSRFPDLQVSIEATDIDTTALQKAKDACYALNPQDVKNEPRLKRWLEETETYPKDMVVLSGQSVFKVKEELRRMISFKQMNLIRKWTLHTRYHVVFCRNVIIYFDKDTQREMFAQMVEQMTDDAILYLGHSESLLGVSDRFKLVGQATHQNMPPKGAA